LDDFATVTSVLIGLMTVFDAGRIVTLPTIIGGDGVDIGQYDEWRMFISISHVVLAVFAAGMFLAWLRQARVNAELIGGPEQHQRSRSWVVLGWLVPILNVWYPYQIMRDIWHSVPVPIGNRSTLVQFWSPSGQQAMPSVLRQFSLFRLANGGQRPTFCHPICWTPSRRRAESSRRCSSS
jgi:hypothetical protein